MLPLLENVRAYEEIAAVISYEFMYICVLGTLAVLLSAMFRGLPWAGVPSHLKLQSAEEEYGGPRWWWWRYPEVPLVAVACIVPFIMSYQASTAAFAYSEALRVCLYGWLTCATTGLGALPFFVVNPENVTEGTIAIANTIACGMMLAASCGMLYEAHEHCGFLDWQIVVGTVAGAVFILCSKALLGSEDDEAGGVEGLRSAVLETKRFNRAALIFVVMFCHSAAEGIAVGVSFDRQLSEHFGLYVTLLLAIHNIPEGTAVALTLVPHGTSPSMASLIAVLTSVPQPFMAVAAFFCVDAFRLLLPVGLAFAAGAMIYVSLHELLEEASEHLSKGQLVGSTMMSFLTMLMLQFALASLAGH
eukprot:TRINITY_DN24072_c0_g1_i1.p1 TRINITY_DN24072_c0_g1~~TRINITY_DN24072_c0_g1_i1.p1  ORF type:complete len:360 (+),score=69.72 TRINITY_DN24072_c0_g1_i1:122-1201(+)